MGKWGEWENKRSCDICKEVGKEPWPYARKERSLIDNFIYHGREAFWNGTAEKRGNGPECFSHDHKINYAATKKSWYKFKEDPEEVVKEPSRKEIRERYKRRQKRGKRCMWKFLCFPGMESLERVGPMRCHLRKREKTSHA